MSLYSGGSNQLSAYREPLNLSDLSMERYITGRPRSHILEWNEVAPGPGSWDGPLRPAWFMQIENDLRPRQVHWHTVHLQSFVWGWCGEICRSLLTWLWPPLDAYSIAYPSGICSCPRARPYLYLLALGRVGGNAFCRYRCWRFTFCISKYFSAIISWNSHLFCSCS